MKKFKDGDVFHNTIKTYPKVNLFLNNGGMHYNRKSNENTSIPTGSVGLFENIRSSVHEVEVFSLFSDSSLTLHLDFSNNASLTYGVPPLVGDIANLAPDTTPVDDFVGNPVNAFTAITGSGLQVGRFNGTSNALASDGWILSDIISMSEWRIFITLKLSAYPLTGTLPINDMIFSDNNARWGVGVTPEGNLYGHNHDGGHDYTAATGLPVSLSTFHLIEYRRSSGVIGVACDEVEQTVSSGDLSAASTFRIGRNTADSRFLNGDIGEIVVYNAEPSAANAQQTRAYLKNKWGIII